MPTLNKNLNDILSVPGKESITVPLGQIKITRKVKSLKIIFRSCTNELIMDQNKHYHSIENFGLKQIEILYQKNADLFHY